jgi:hypothetical protein
MSRKVFVFICLLLAVFLPAVFAEAQQPAKVSRIGYLLAGDPTTDSNRFEAIRLALRELGYYRRTEHRHRAPICGGKTRSAT